MEKRYPRLVLAPVLIPWKEDFSLDEEMMRKELKTMVGSGIKYIYSFGTAGEGYAVDMEMFCEINRVFFDELLDTDATPIAGVISLSAQDMIVRIKKAYEIGFRHFQISFPSWGALTDREVDVFFHQVCDPFPDCSFMHYNNGGRSKKLLKAADYKRLAPMIPNLTSVKFMNDSLEDILNVMRADLPIQFVLSEYGYGLGSLYGECSLLFSSIGTHAPTGWRLFNAGIEGDLDTIREIEKEVALSQEILFRICNTPVINAAYDKLYIKSVIPEFPMRLYPPYQTFADEQVEAYIRAMKEELPGWFEGR